jgi:hypothetical protein
MSTRSPQILAYIQYENKSYSDMRIQAKEQRRLGYSRRVCHYLSKVLVVERGLYNSIFFMIELKIMERTRVALNWIRVLRGDTRAVLVFNDVAFVFYQSQVCILGGRDTDHV